MNKKQEQEQYFVSVIIAVKNAAGTLQRCIDSFSEQTLTTKELIIIDGDSNDGSVDIISANSDVISYFVSKADNGIAQAWNRGIGHSKGDWIIFLGADDYFYNPDVLKQFCDEVSLISSAAGRIVYGKLQMVLPSGEYLHTEGEEWKKIKSTFFSDKMLIPHPACFHHRSTFNEFGLFDEKYKIALDYEFLLRVLKHEHATFLPELIITNMSYGGLSSQVSNLLLILNETTSSLEKHGFKPKGIKRLINKLVYKALIIIVKAFGENTARQFLDIIRRLSGKPPIWTRK